MKRLLLENGTEIGEFEFNECPRVGEFISITNGADGPTDYKVMAVRWYPNRLDVDVHVRLSPFLYDA